MGAMWLRRQATKFNGVSYITQAGAAAVFSKEGLKQVRESIDYYKANAEIMTGTMDTLGWWYTGGKNSPYVWVKCPDSKKSWDFFDELLDRVNVVCTPGAGFGACGEGFIRLTAFSTNENTREAMDRIIKAYKKQDKSALFRADFLFDKTMRRRYNTAVYIEGVANAKKCAASQHSGKRLACFKLRDSE